MLEEIKVLQGKGIIEPSKSEWASPIIAVPKPNGNVRICVDVRRLNVLTKPMSYCMPTMNEIVERVGQSNMISKLYLAKGFHQIPVKEQYKDKTTFVSPVGKFKYQRMPFGLRNAPAVFQQMIEQALKVVVISPKHI